MWYRFGETDVSTRMRRGNGSTKQVVPSTRAGLQTFICATMSIRDDWLWIVDLEMATGDSMLLIFSQSKWRSLVLIGRSCGICPTESEDFAVLELFRLAPDRPIKMLAKVKDKTVQSK